MRRVGGGAGRGGGGHSDKIVEVQCQGSSHHQLELSPTLREVLQSFITLLIPTKPMISDGQVG